MELVDSPLQQRLWFACRPVHRVDRHTVVDPARGVALEERVRHRRHDEIGLAVCVSEQRRILAARHIEHGDPADEMLRQPHRRHLVEPGPQDACAAKAYFVRRDASIEYPRPGLLIGEHLRQQVVQLQHLDTALAHLQHEVVVILLRLVYPHHVVEQQLGAVPRREPLVREPGTAHHHRPQVANFTVNTKLVHRVTAISARAENYFLAASTSAASRTRRRRGASPAMSVRHCTQYVPLRLFTPWVSWPNPGKRRFHDESARR